MKTKFYLVLGDWSNDGHGKYEKVLLESNKTVKEMQDAYKASCKKTGVSFNINENYTGIKRSVEDAMKHEVCTDYEDSKLSEEVYEIFKEFECQYLEDLEEYLEEYWVDQESFINLLLWFIGLSLEDFKWKLCIFCGFSSGFGRKVKICRDDIWKIC